jgi:hypothetical protein
VPSGSTRPVPTSSYGSIPNGRPRTRAEWGGLEINPNPWDDSNKNTRSYLGDWDLREWHERRAERKGGRPPKAEVNRGTASLADRLDRRSAPRYQGGYV